MEFSEALISSGARKILQFWERRDIYFQAWLVQNYHTFFEDTIAANSFPIVLLWDWKFNEYILSFIEASVAQFNSRTWNIVFITKRDGGTFDISIFEKKKPDEVPHWNIEPIHSTHMLYWKEVWKMKMTIESIPTQTTINTRYLAAIENQK